MVVISITVRRDLVSSAAGGGAAEATNSQAAITGNCWKLILIFYTLQEGQPLVQKAGVTMDFSYVPSRSDHFQIYCCAQKWIDIKNIIIKKSTTGRQKLNFLF